MADISDFEINNRVRRELVTRRFDTSTLRFGSAGGSVNISGKLHFTGGDIQPPEIPRILHQLEQAVRAIPGVKGFKIDIEEWERNPAGRWVGRQAGPQSRPDRGGEQTVPKQSAEKSKRTPAMKPEIMAMIIPVACQSCGMSLYQGYMFCEHCGSSVQLKQNTSTVRKCARCSFRTFNPAADNCPDCAEILMKVELNYLMYRCSRCGHIKSKIQNFCPECGFDLAESAAFYDKISVSESMDSQHNQSADGKTEPAVNPEEPDHPQTIQERVREIMEEGREKELTRKTRPADSDDILKMK
ncbi:MAG: hypothetical protein PHQ23_07540 [Candidatus Wallbacteria bacterium]|nr:hypothetical protein [Candidatus Wallbacteria bacterium]